MIPLIAQNIDCFPKGWVNNMLVLNRKIGESIILDDNIEIKVLGIQEGKIKLGIEAPRNISILRKEVFDLVVEENKNSLEADFDISILTK